MSRSKGSVSVEVQFAPATTGTFTGALVIVDNTAGSPHTIALTGSAAPVPSFPLVLSLSPGNAPAGGAGFSLSVGGSGFASNAQVLWNGAVRATLYLSSTYLLAEILAADIAKESTGLVTVANPAPNAAIAAAQPLAVVASASPVAAISGASLAVGNDDSGNHVLTLTGTDFVSGSTVQWNGMILPTNYISPWQISATVTPADLSSWPVTLTVNNPAGTSAGFVLP